MTGLGTLHPDSCDMKGDIEHLIESGLKGVKLHPDIQDFKIDDYRALSIYEACEERGVPILFHAGDSRYDRSNPNRLVPVLRIYTRLKVIAAHFGGYSIWDEAVEALAGIPNLYVDCSSAMPFLTDEKIKEYVRRYGEDRVLFGTDYPMWGSESEVERLLSLGLSDGAYRKIFSENARALLGL
jgi:predicted TIM-barrel fold metal-dependent hydrolase